MRYDLTPQQERDKEKFLQWLIDKMGGRGTNADTGAMMDEYDPLISREANEDYFIRHYGLSRHTPEQHRQMYFDQVAGEVVTKLRDADERMMRKIANTLGYTIRKKRESPRIVWETYGHTSWYTPKEAVIIVAELKTLGFETIVFNDTFSNGDKQCVVKYKRDLTQPAPVLSIE